MSVKTQQCGVRNIYYITLAGLHVSSLLSHLHALKAQIHTISGILKF
jgi:hypothetical protein